MPIPVDIEQLQRMRDYYNSGATRSYDFRKKQLLKLKQALQKWQPQLSRALYTDLHKSVEESFITEIGFTQSEITYTLKNLSKWMRPKKVSSPLMTFRSAGRIIREPWGIALVIAPWNYPIQLTLSPIVGAIAGGNCIVLKPSEFAPHTASALRLMLEETFDKEYLYIIEGNGAEVVPGLINNFRFDHVFFTGSMAVGREIAKMTAPQFIPTLLELGGKSPCIVDEHADIDIAAKRIAWGKFTNAGQSCVAPDYLLVHESRKEELLSKLQARIKEFYTDSPETSPDYGRIINEKRFDKLLSYLSQGDIISGGVYNRDTLYLSPTIMENVVQEKALMQEEIFGPILPLITYKKYEDALNIIRHNPDPLALYIFSTDRSLQKKYTEEISFGGGCINNTLVHLANPQLPFGGIAQSGMGMYHGKYGFETYTRAKAILKTAAWPDASIKYPPYKGKIKFFKWFMK